AVAHVRGARRAVVAAERAGRLLGVGRTGLSREPAAGLCDVTLTRRGAAREGVRQHDVGRTRGAHAGADFVRIAGVARACAAYRARISGGVLARVVGPVAGVRGARVAIAGACRPRRALGVGGAACAGPGAVLRRVALPGRRAALGEPRQEAVRRTRRARARARLGDVAGPCRRAARGPGIPRVVNAQRGGEAAIALIGRTYVAVIRACHARRLDRVAGARGAVPRTVFREVALVHCRATRERGRLERVIGTRAAAAGTRLRNIASAARRRAARRARVTRRVL